MITEKQEIILFEELNNAFENGYTFEGWTALMIAEDVCHKSHLFETFNPATLISSIEKYFKKRSV